MTIVAWSDIHITNKNTKYKKNKYGVSDLIVRQLKFVEQMVEETKDIDDVVYLFGGDLTDHATFDPVTFRYLSRMVSKVVNTGKPCIFLEGNHCITDTNNNFTVLSALDEIVNRDNVYFVYSNQVLNIGRYRFYCLPYSSDYASAQAQIKKWSDEANLSSDASINVLTFHFPCKNAFLDNGTLSPSGLELDGEAVDKFNICLGGDYHTHQLIPGTKGAFYIGAPFSLHHGEHMDRGYVLVDFQNRESYSMRRVSNKHALDIIDVHSDLEIDNIKNPENTFLRLVEFDTDKDLSSFYDFSYKRKKPEKEDLDIVIYDDVETASFDTLMLDALSEMGEDYLSVFEDIKIWSS